MTFESREKSAQLANPIELYRFENNYNIWTYASGDEEISLFGNTYYAAPLKRSAPAQSKETEHTVLNIAAPTNLGLVQEFLGYVPQSLYTLTIHRMHRDDLDPVVYWQGRVRGISIQNSEANIQCDPLLAILKRVGLRRQYAHMCQHILYDQRCGVNEADFTFSSEIIAINGSELTIAPIGSSWNDWAAWVTPSATGSPRDGFIRRSTGEMRLIIEWLSADRPVDTDILLKEPFVQGVGGLTVGETVDLVLGCDHTVQDCRETFNNLLNYGGFTFISRNNPFVTPLLIPVRQGKSSVV